MAHTKRLIAPSFWGGGKRTSFWAPTPKPGKHPKARSLTILSAVRDVLGFAKTSREVRFILANHEVRVDGAEVKRRTVAIGLMDVLEFVTTKQHFRVVPSKAGLGIIEIPAAEAHLKILQLVRKTSVRGNKTQLTFHDGRTLLVAREAAKTYSVGDSVVFDLKTKSVKQHLKLEKNVLGLIYQGMHRGAIGKVVELKHGTRGEDTVVIDVGKKNLETLKAYLIPVGTGTPAIQVRKHD